MIQLTSPLVWRTEASGVVHVSLPLENLEFSALKHDSFRTLAVEALRQWYAGCLQRVVLTRPKIQEVSVETLAVSLEWVNDSLSEPNATSGQNMNRLTVPINTALRRNLFIRPYGRDNEARELAVKLTGKPNLILCGPAGCGKSTLLIEAALMAQKQLTRNDDETKKRTETLKTRSSG